MFERFALKANVLNRHDLRVVGFWFVKRGTIANESVGAAPDEEEKDDEKSLTESKKFDRVKKFAQKRLEPQ